MFHVSDEVCKALGKTPEEIYKMSLYKFSNLVFDKGFLVRVSDSELTESGQGGLSITMKQRINNEPPTIS